MLLRRRRVRGSANADDVEDDSDDDGVDDTRREELAAENADDDEGVKVDADDDENDGDVDDGMRAETTAGEGRGTTVFIVVDVIISDANEALSACCAEAASTSADSEAMENESMGLLAVGWEWG